MDPLHVAAAAPLPWRIAGREYSFAPLRLADYAELERRILAARPDLWTALRQRLPELPETAQRVLLAAAWDELRRGPRVTLEELEDWLRTPAGQFETFWLSLRREQPEVTREEAERLFDLARQEELGSQPAEEPGGNVPGQA